MVEELKKCYAEAREQMDQAIDHLETELQKIRAGKANVSMVNGIMVDAYGSQMPLNQVATVSTPDARTIAIQPWDKAVMAEIEKAIMGANIGLTPQNDGSLYD